MSAATYLDSEFFVDPKNRHHIRWVHAGKFCSTKCAFIILVRYHQYYKWIWLNRGDGRAKITFSVADDLRFWDEKQAGMIGVSEYRALLIPSSIPYFEAA